jgi:hypothetical protein
MAREQVGEIRINPRTVRIGHQVYPPANISRVQTVEVRWGGKRATARPLKEIAVPAVLFSVVAGAILVAVPALDLGGDRLTTQLLMGAIALFGVRIVYLILLFVAYGNQYNQSGHHNQMNVSNTVSNSDVDAAVAELRAFVEHPRRTGPVAPDGTVTNPATVVGGAKDAVLSVVKAGVAALVVALLGG